MTLYSHYPHRRNRQIVTDALALLFIGAWIWLGITVYQLIDALSGFGVQMEEAGAGFKDAMGKAGDTLGNVPLIGDGIRAPFDGASGSGAALEAAGESQQVAVHQLALVLGVGVAALPILMIIALWLVPRIRFALRAGRALSAARSEAGIDLLALRALATQKVSVLARIDPAAMAAWRRGDEAVMRSLAELELRSAGVRLRG